MLRNPDPILRTRHATRIHTAVSASSEAPSELVPRFAAASRASILTHPGRSVVRSTDVGWTSLLLEVFESDAAAVASDTAYESPPTPDQTLVVSLGGDYELGCCSNGVWRWAARSAGSAGLTPAGVTDRLRWRARGPDSIRSAHVYLPSSSFDDAGEHFRRAGTQYRTDALSSLGFHDAVVAQAVLSLVRAAEAGAPDLYAQAVAQYLAVHLLSFHSGWAHGTADDRSPGPLTDRRLARVLEYMTAHYREPLALERLAAEAGISKFHFVRLFRAATGEAPYAYLVRLRMRAARRLLGDTDLTVAEVAGASGYPSATHFGRAFARHAGRSPSAFRAEVRARRRPA